MSVGQSLRNSNVFGTGFPSSSTSPSKKKGSPHLVWVAEVHWWHCKPSDSPAKRRMQFYFQTSCPFQAIFGKKCGTYFPLEIEKKLLAYSQIVLAKMKKKPTPRVNSSPRARVRIQIQSARLTLNQTLNNSTKRQKVQQPHSIFVKMSESIDL